MSVPQRRTKVCRLCGHRKYLSAFSRHTSTADGLENRCKTCRNRRYGRGKKAGICVDCDRPCHKRRRRCEPCREKYQAQAEAVLSTLPVTDGLCGLPTRTGGCVEPLSYGTDFLGRTTTNCVRHGERLLPVRGVHHYDQRVTFEDEQDAAFERACKPPQVHGTSAHRNGMHWRQKTNEYLTKGAA